MLVKKRSKPKHKKRIIEKPPSICERITDLSIGASSDFNSFQRSTENKIINTGSPERLPVISMFVNYFTNNIFFNKSTYKLIEQP